MKKIWNYNKFKFINENLIKEYSEFNQYQMDVGTQNPLGPGYGFAIDPSLSIYGTDADSPYVDYYSRMGGAVNRLNQITKNALNKSDIDLHVNDDFINDLENFTNYKILRIFRNNSLYLDIFISFEFDEKEFFGMFKNYNKDNNNIEFKCELYNNPEYPYIDQEYKLKLSRYIKNKLDKWFKPEYKLYKNLKNECPVKNIMGEQIKLKENIIIEVTNVDFEKDGSPFVEITHNNIIYYIKGNDYYFFNYWFEKID